MSAIALSIIICSYNRAPFVEENLPPLLEQIKKSEHNQNVEVILVDNNSSDNIKDVIEKIKQNHANVSYTLETEQGLSNARNHGWKKATGTYIAYLDDDATVHKDWLQTALDCIHNEVPLLIGGPVYPDFEASPPWWIHQNDFIRLRNYPIGPLPDNRAPKGFAGGNMIIKKSTLEELHGFDPRYGMAGETTKLGEEVEFSLRVFDKYGNKTFNHPDLAVDHFEPAKKLTLQGYRERNQAAGQSMYTLRRQRGVSKLQCSYTAMLLLVAGALMATAGLIPVQKSLSPSIGISRFFQGISIMRCIFTCQGNTIQLVSKKP